MKIYCFSNTYNDSEPYFHFRPEACLLQKNKHFFYPEHSNLISLKTHFVIKINRIGKFIDEKYASEYYSQYTIGFELTAEDTFKQKIEKKLPTDNATSFEYSLPIGMFSNINNIEDKILLRKNNEDIYQFSLNEIKFKIDRIISSISTFSTLKIGDLIYTGCPFDSIPIKINDVFEAELNNIYLRTKIL